MQFMNAFRNAWAIPLLRALLLAIPAGILAAPAAAGGLDPLLFESRPPGANPGAAAISNQIFPGHSFRLEQRAHVTALGAHLVGAVQAPGSVFAALYRIGTQDAAPGVINDHNLVATTLLEVVSNQPDDIYGTVDVTLEPGWYALIVGTGRHGASAGALQVRMPAAASQTTPRSWGPYSVNAGTGAASLNAARTRFMVHGTLLPPLPLPPEQFLDETARPWAWSEGYLPAVGNGEHLAVRFSLEHAVRLERVDTWLRTLSGNVYAAIFATAGPASPLPDPHSSGYDGLALASALIQGQPGWPDEYGTDLDVLLPPGHYALILGSDRFGATGHAQAMVIDDHIVRPGLERHNGNSWLPLSQNTIQVRLAGSLPPLVPTPQQLDFGSLLDGDQTTLDLQLHNQGSQPLALAGAQIQGPDASQFELAGDLDDCLLLAPDTGCSLSLAYRPAGPGNHDASLVLASTGDPAAATVALQGNSLPWSWVTPQVQGEGAIEPAQPQRIVHGHQAGFQLLPGIGHHLAEVTSSCGGSLEGEVFTTGPIQAECTVNARFAIDIFQVSASIDDSGSIDPAGTILVEYGQTPAFTISPDPGHHLDNIAGSCPGTLAGNIFTLAPVNADCSLHAHLALDPATTLTVVSGSNQSTSIDTDFAQPLVLRLSNDAGLPVPGVAVNFHAPGTGPSATVPVQANSNGQGLVSVSARANSQTGAYTILASADGIQEPARFHLANLPPHVELTLAVDNGLDYIAYGARAEWLLTLGNTGKEAAHGAEVLVPLPAQLDAGLAEWFCLDPDSGCRSAGTGALDDTGLHIPSDGQVQYLISAPVLPQAAGNDILLVAYAEVGHHVPVGASDRTTLVLFRDGFQTAPVDDQGATGTDHDSHGPSTMPAPDTPAGD